MLRQLDWKMRVTTICDSVDKIVLFHPTQYREYTVRLDSGRRLMRECVVRYRLDSMTAVLEYNRAEAEVEKPHRRAGGNMVEEERTPLPRPDGDARERDSG